MIRTGQDRREGWQNYGQQSWYKRCWLDAGRLLSQHQHHGASFGKSSFGRTVRAIFHQGSVAQDHGRHYMKAGMAFRHAL